MNKSNKSSKNWLIVLLILSLGANLYLIYLVGTYSKLVEEMSVKGKAVPKPLNVFVISPNEVKNLVNKYLDKRLLSLSYDAGGINIGDKRYLLVVFHDSSHKSRLLEIVNNEAFDYHINGDLPMSYNKDHSKMMVKDLTASGVPEFIYQTASGGTGGEQKKIWIINLPKRELAEGERQYSYDTYGGKEIKLNKVAQENNPYKDYITNNLAALEFVEKDDKRTYKILYQFWYENNGVNCSQLKEPCNLKILWINFPGEEKFFGDWSKATEAENDNYKVISMFKGGVFLIDKKTNKIALIYLPESEYDFIDEIKIKGNNIKLNRGDTSIAFDINDKKLFKPNK
ncbi:MAG: hypothetical protein AB1491_03375 [Thermodesulfobacteriota bacterium]